MNEKSLLLEKLVIWMVKSWRCEIYCCCTENDSQKDDDDENDVQKDDDDENDVQKDLQFIVVIQSCIITIYTRDISTSKELKIRIGQ